MFSVFQEAKSFFKHIEKVNTDNIVFRLHYKATVLLLLCFMALLGSKQYFGEPILCNKTGSDAVMDVFCWIHGTWTVEELHRRLYRGEVPHSGIGFMEPGFKKVNHSYYQWVPVVLLLSAAAFYLPRHLWKSEERGRMAAITTGMNVHGEKDVEAMAIRLSVFLRNRRNFHYAQRFAFCEVLNFLNLLLQWSLLDVFLEGQFISYGSNCLRYAVGSGSMAGPQGYNPMDKVFPKMAKCSYSQIAGEGALLKKDALCTLPLNIINDRVFLILWFWLAVLSLATGLALLFRVSAVLSRTLRRLVLARYASPETSKLLPGIVTALHYHNWFLLVQVAKNIDPDILDALLARLDTSEAPVLLQNKALPPESPFLMSRAPKSPNATLLLPSPSPSGQPVKYSYDFPEHSSS